MVVSICLYVQILRNNTPLFLCKFCSPTALGFWIILFSLIFSHFSDPLLLLLLCACHFHVHASNNVCSPTFCHKPHSCLTLHTLLVNPSYFLVFSTLLHLLVTSSSPVFCYLCLFFFFCKCAHIHTPHTVDPSSPWFLNLQIQPIMD